MIDIRSIGVGSLVVCFEQKIDPFISDQALGLANTLMATPLKGQLDVVVSYASVGVYWAITDSVGFEHQKNEILKRYAQLPERSSTKARLFEIETQYKGADLAAIAEQKNLTISEVVEIHAAESYRVYAIGFLPGFAYLGAVSEKLSLERKSTPMPVKAGSVAIAAGQTAVYPQNSPGGWWVLGYTDFVFYDAKKGATLAVGDQVRFVPK